MADPIGTKAMARLAQVSPAAVRRARAGGRVVANAGGKFDVDHPRNALWLRGRRARTTPDQRSRDLDAKLAAAVSKLRLAKDRYETTKERYVDRAEAIHVAGAEAEYFLDYMRRVPERQAAAFAERLGIDVATAQRILERFIGLVLGEIGDLRGEAIRAAETA